MDQHAYNTLVATYGDRVEVVARTIRSYKRLDIPLEDLVQTGMEGMFMAAERYDPTKGVAFWTYAEYRVRGHILNSLDDMRWLPGRIVEKTTDVVEAQLADAAPSSGTAARFFCSVTAQMFATMVLEIKSNEPSPESTTASQQDSRALWEAVEQLPSRERTVIESHFRAGVPFVEIAHRLNIDKSGVSRLYKQALRRLRTLVGDGVVPEGSDTPSDASSGKPEHAAELT